MHAILTVPENIVEQSDNAKAAARYLDEKVLLTTPAEAPGLVTISTTVYALREVKADGTHHDKETLDIIADNNADTRDARAYVKNRNKALIAVTAAHAMKSALAKGKADILAARAA